MAWRVALRTAGAPRRRTSPEMIESAEVPGATMRLDRLSAQVEALTNQLPASPA